MTRGPAPAVLAGLALLAGAPAGVQDRPLAVLLLVDRSLSMSRAPIVHDQHAREALSAFVQALQPADLAAIGVVASRVRLGAFTAAHGSLAGPAHLAVPDEDRFGPSPLVDAIDDALGMVARAGGERRRAVVLWTDGRSTGNVRSVAEVAGRAATLSVSLRIVAEPPWPAIRDLPDPCALFVPIVQATGGACIVNPSHDRGRRSPAALIAQAVRDVRSDHAQHSAIQSFRHSAIHAFTHSCSTVTACRMAPSRR
jgi:hypothetical protein